MHCGMSWRKSAYPLRRHQFHHGCCDNEEIRSRTTDDLCKISNEIQQRAWIKLQKFREEENKRKSELAVSEFINHNRDMRRRIIMEQALEEGSEIIKRAKLRHEIDNQHKRIHEIKEKLKHLKDNLNLDDEVSDACFFRKCPASSRFRCRSANSIACRLYYESLMRMRQYDLDRILNRDDLPCCYYATTLEEKVKQMSIEIEQLNARVVEAEMKLKTEVQRIKKKMQIQITELEMSLDVANKTNIDLQKTIKKQSLQMTELQAHYDEVQRQLQVTLDQLSVAQRRIQSLTAECEDIRGNYETALRGKRAVEQQYEECCSRINELTTINVNLQSTKIKIEQELQSISSEYEEVTKELRISEERYTRVQSELKHTIDILHEEQERIVKIEAIKKSLEIEVRNISVRLEEVEANAIVGGKRVISKLEARIKDLELELDEEKRRHAETIKILRKKERTVKEIIIQSEEDQKNITILQESLDKVNQKINMYKRQLQEQEGMSQQSVTRVRRFQRELEAAEDRAEAAESNLSIIRAKHRTFVTSSTVPGSQVYMIQETRTTTDVN